MKLFNAQRFLCRNRKWVISILKVKDNFLGTIDNNSFLGVVLVDSKFKYSFYQCSCFNSCFGIPITQENGKMAPKLTPEWGFISLHIRSYYKTLKNTLQKKYFHWLLNIECSRKSEVNNRIPLVHLDNISIVWWHYAGSPILCYNLWFFISLSNGPAKKQAEKQ